MGEAAFSPPVAHVPSTWPHPIHTALHTCVTPTVTSSAQGERCPLPVTRLGEVRHTSRASSAQLCPSPQRGQEPLAARCPSIGFTTFGPPPRARTATGGRQLRRSVIFSRAVLSVSAVRCVTTGDGEAARCGAAAWECVGVGAVCRSAGRGGAYLGGVCRKGGRARLRRVPDITTLKHACQ